GRVVQHAPPAGAARVRSSSSGSIIVTSPRRHPNWRHSRNETSGEPGAVQLSDYGLVCSLLKTKMRVDVVVCETGPTTFGSMSFGGGTTISGRDARRGTSPARQTRQID